MKIAKLYLSLVLLISSHSVLANTPIFSYAPTIYPYAFYQTGKYDYKTADDKGSFRGMGIGAKFGMKVPFLLLGADVTYVKPSFESDWEDENVKRYTKVNETRHPLVDQEMVSYGPTISLRLWRVTFNYTYFFKQEIKGVVENDYANQSDATYTYEGTGEKIGLAINFMKGLTLDISRVTSTFDEYTLSDDINGESAANGASRDPLEMDTLTFAIAYDISFNDFKNLF